MSPTASATTKLALASSSSSSKLVQQARPRSWPCRVGHDVAGAEPLGFRPNLAMRLRCAPRGGRCGSPVRHAQPTCCAARMKAGMPPPRTPSAKRQAQVVDRLRRALMRAPTPAEFTTSTPSDSPVARRHHAPPSCGRRPSPSSRLNSAESLSAQWGQLSDVSAHANLYYCLGSGFDTKIEIRLGGKSEKGL